MALIVTADERAELQRRTRSRKIRGEDARRGRIILMLADGESFTDDRRGRRLLSSVHRPLERAVRNGASRQLVDDSSQYQVPLFGRQTSKSVFPSPSMSATSGTSLVTTWHSRAACSSATRPWATFHSSGIWTETERGI
jgi:hypothetical protein